MSLSPLPAVTADPVATRAAAKRLALTSSTPQAAPPPPASPPPRLALVPPPPVASTPAPAPSDDARLLAILDAPLVPGEPAHSGFRRKEHELGEAFAALDVMAARALHLRLRSPKAGDVLAAAFGRLTEDRRGRLLAFLGDARRRAAIAACRR
jgi:hypothetical protein